MTSYCVSPLSVAKYDFPFHLKTLLSEPLASISTLTVAELFDKALSHQNILLSYIHGWGTLSIKEMITAEKISLLSKDYFTHRELITKRLSMDCGYTLLNLSPENAVFVVKAPENTTLYAIFKKICWKGGHKKVFPVLEFGHDVILRALCYTSYDFEVHQELSMRSISAIQKVATSILRHMPLCGKHFVITEFARMGNIAQYDLSRLSLVSKDSIAFKLLEAMHQFHSVAVHKDLNAANILLDGPGYVDKVFINDFCGTRLLTDIGGAKEVSCHAIHLAPELQKRCVALKGFIWLDAFDADFSYQEWILHKRYQIGIILAHIYLDHDVFEFQHARQHPFFYQSFDKVIQTPQGIHSLYQEMSEEEFDRIVEIYSEAFDRFYWSLIHIRDDLPYGLHNMQQPPFGYSGPRLAGAPDELVLKNPDDVMDTSLMLCYMNLFDEYFNSHELRVLLEPYMSSDQKAEVATLLKKVYLDIAPKRFEYLSQFKFHNSECSLA